MRVLVTAGTLGGVWTYARELVSGLLRRGVTVTLVSFGDIPTPAQMRWMDALPGLDFRPTAFRLEWMQEAPEDLPASREFLRAVIEETRPDLLHLNQYAYGDLEVGIPKVVVAHSDVVSWWAAVHGGEPRDSAWMRWYRRTVARGLAGADMVVAPSGWMLKAVYAHYTRPRQGMVIYNGRTPALFNPHVSKEHYVLSVGRLWDGGKQVALLTQQEQTLPVYVVGSEQHPERALGGGDDLRPAGAGVRFQGPRSEGELRQLYSRAALYAATARYEPFGLAPLEAAFSRCALVVNDIPSLREVWGSAACYFRRNDARHLAQTIARLAQDRELRLTYANLAYQRARNRYSAGRMVDDYLRLYHAMQTVELAA